MNDSLELVYRLRGVNHVRPALLGGTATVVVLTAAICPSAEGSAPKRFDRNGIAFAYPKSWVVTTKALSNGSLTIPLRSGISSRVELEHVAETDRPDAVVEGVAELLDWLWVSGPSIGALPR
jgi:hypothetical protein